MSTAEAIRGYRRRLHLSNVNDIGPLPAEARAVTARLTRIAALVTPRAESFQGLDRRVAKDFDSKSGVPARLLGSASLSSQPGKEMCKPIQCNRGASVLFS